MKLSKNFRKILSSILSNPPSSDKLNLLKKDLFIIEFSDWEKSISILNRYIEESEIDLDKSKIQSIMRQTYQEACEMI